MRSTLIVALLAVALAIPAAAVGASTSSTAETVSVRHAISWQRTRTWHWQDVARVRRSPEIPGAADPAHSIGYVHWIEHRWNARRVAAYKIAHRPRPTLVRTPAATGGVANEAMWLCIHSREGAWNANTGNGYYGGLQMTSGWGGVARPDLLSPVAQMQLAERGYAASGFSRAWLFGQWPNTAPPCV